ncbi:hypothetical protein [Aestuariibacter salexigens]|uniref:hypothetical protein n=1 Tax=Aestuariibacter salexigens TaxID=226010 RepID=UPI000422B31A|nr:hypothetical protein [Aestuariibacter salexigens]
MIDQIILLTIILAPCVAFTVGAMLFSLVNALRTTTLSHAHHSSAKSSYLSFQASFRLPR